jgi:hypothetical protein
VPYQTKVVLHCRSGLPTNLEALVEAFIRDGVKFVGVLGQGLTMLGAAGKSVGRRATSALRYLALMSLIKLERAAARARR